MQKSRCVTGLHHGLSMSPLSAPEDVRRRLDPRIGLTLGPKERPGLSRIGTLYQRSEWTGIDRVDRKGVTLRGNS